MPFIVNYPPGKTWYRGKPTSNVDIAEIVLGGLKTGKHLIRPDFAERLGYKIEWIGPQRIQVYFTDGDGI